MLCSFFGRRRSTEAAFQQISTIFARPAAFDRRAKPDPSRTKSKGQLCYVRFFGRRRSAEAVFQQISTIFARPAALGRRAKPDPSRTKSNGQLCYVRFSDGVGRLPKPSPSKCRPLPHDVRSSPDLRSRPSRVVGATRIASPRARWRFRAAAHLDNMRTAIMLHNPRPPRECVT